MPGSFYGRTFGVGRVSVALDSSGNGSIAVTWATDCAATFIAPPAAFAVPYEGDDGTLVLSSITATGATLTVTGSRVRSVTAPFTVLVAEKT